MISDKGISLMEIIEVEVPLYVEKLGLTIGRLKFDDDCSFPLWVVEDVKEAAFPAIKESRWKCSRVFCLLI